MRSTRRCRAHSERVEDNPLHPPPPRAIPRLAAPPDPPQPATMDPARQPHFRPAIVKRLAEIETELAALVDDTQAISPDVSIGRLSRLDSMQQQQMALAGKRRLEEERARLREADHRIDAGTYGRCLLCGQDIADERLDYQPDAVTCVPCLRRKK